jgi:hypothetical protein
LELPEIIALTKHFVEYIETGDTTWMKKTEEYLLEKMQEIDGVLID